MFYFLFKLTYFHLIYEYRLTYVQEDARYTYLFLLPSLVSGIGPTLAIPKNTLKESTFIKLKITQYSSHLKIRDSHLMTISTYKYNSGIYI